MNNLIQNGVYFDVKLSAIRYSTKLNIGVLENH